MRWRLAVAIGLLGLLVVRLRERLSFSGDWHLWLHELGVPTQVRHLDSPLVMLIASFAAYCVVSAGRVNCTVTLAPTQPARCAPVATFM